MARIRTVKPEFWTSEQVMECSPLARLLFIGMWNFADDYGVLPVGHKALKAKLFPADDLLVSDIERMVGELLAAGLLIQFEAEGRQWWAITGWHHQVINRRSQSRFPRPPLTKEPLPLAAGFDDDMMNSDAEYGAEHGIAPEKSVPFMEDSLSPHGAITEGSPPEGKGREGKGVNLGSKASVVVTLPSTPEQPQANSRKARVVWMLRKGGMADAAVSYLTDDTWESILALRTDEEIVELALAKQAARPGQRTGLKYVAPALLEPPVRMTAGEPKARASPGRMGGRQAAMSKYAAEAAAARGETNDHITASRTERDITGECRVVA